MVVIVLGKVSTIWRRTSMRTLIREEELRYVEVEEMRVVMNDKHIAEQIKSDKRKSIVMNGVKIGKGDEVESVVMNGSKVGKFVKIDGNKI